MLGVGLGARRGDLKPSCFAIQAVNGRTTGATGVPDSNWVGSTGVGTADIELIVDDEAVVTGSSGVVADIEESAVDGKGVLGKAW